MLRRTWLSVKEIMAPGALGKGARMKEMLYLAVSTSNQCGYCIASHTAAARKAGMTDAMLAELMAVVGMANETNRLASGYRVEIDEQFETGVKAGEERSDPSIGADVHRSPVKQDADGLADMDSANRFREKRRNRENLSCWAIASPVEPVPCRS